MRVIPCKKFLGVSIDGTGEKFANALYFRTFFMISLTRTNT